MHLLFGGKNQKPQKKIDNDITDAFKVQLKKQFCDICAKQPSAKVAFGRQFKPVFTCSNCQLNAVGGSVQRLGPKTLISNDKFTEILTKQLISYQNNTKNPPSEHKKPIENCEALKNKLNDLTSKINGEYKKMKKNAKQKNDQLYQQSIQQNTIPIFQQVAKFVKEKKLNQLDDGKIIAKRSLCNQKGLCFSDQMAIQTANVQTEQKFQNLKKQSKVKLKKLEDLVDEINNIEI